MSYTNCSCTLDGSEVHEEPRLKYLDFWVDGVLTAVFSLLGILGNFVTILIFSRKEVQSTFHTNLTVLAVFDLSFNFICGLDASLKAFDFDKNVVHSEWACQGTGPNPAWVGLYPYVFWPFSNIFMTASMYMTVAISIDRYIVVCYPFYACERESVMNNPQNCPVDWKRVVKYRVVQK